VDAILELWKVVQKRKWQRITDNSDQIAGGEEGRVCGIEFGGQRWLPRSLRPGEARGTRKPRSVADVRATRTKEKIGHSGRDDITEKQLNERSGGTRRRCSQNQDGGELRTKEETQEHTG